MMWPRKIKNKCSIMNKEEDKKLQAERGAEFDKAITFNEWLEKYPFSIDDITFPFAKQAFDYQQERINLLTDSSIAWEERALIAEDTVEKLLEQLRDAKERIKYLNGVIYDLKNKLNEILKEHSLVPPFKDIKTKKIKAGKE